MIVNVNVNVNMNVIVIVIVVVIVLVVVVVVLCCVGGKVDAVGGVPKIEFEVMVGV